MADLESINKRYARVEKIARTQKDKDSVAEFNILQKIKTVLEDGKSARTIDFTEEEQKIVKGLFLLTTKPVLYVANVDEDQANDMLRVLVYRLLTLSNQGLPRTSPYLHHPTQKFLPQHEPK